MLQKAIRAVRAVDTSALQKSGGPAFGIKSDRDAGAPVHNRPLDDAGVGLQQVLRTNGIASIDVRQDVMDTYNVAMQRDINAIEAWRVLGSKYYRSASGRVVTQWPHTMTTYKIRTSVPDMEAFQTFKVKETESPAKV